MLDVELQDGQTGRLIVLEGDTNVISTQLRLLPPSPKIMILPSLLEHLTPENENDALNARAFIQYLQKAVTQRTETARSFLQSSTPTQPRLVFAVHGSTNARATCIAKISQIVTNGDVAEAESIFNEIVKDGVAGLMKQEIVEAQEQAKAESGNDKQGGSEEALGAIIAEAAELENSLEKEAAISTYGGSILERMPSRAIPPQRRVLSAMRIMGQATQFNGQPEANEQVSKVSKGVSSTVNSDQIVRTVLTVPNRGKATLLEKRITFRSQNGGIQFDQHASGLSHQVYDTDTEDEFDDPNFASPGEYSVTSIPATPRVVYGEACLVDVQSGSPTKSVKRAQSVDKFYPINARFLEPTPSQALKQTRSHYHLRERPQTSAGIQTEGDPDWFPTLPRTTFVKASETTIKRSPTSTRSSGSSNSSSSSMEMPERAIFVDRGTDAEDVSLGESKGKPFVPVFDLVEDLIIHFTDDNPNEIFESVVESYKNGSYPIVPSPPAVVKSPSNTSTSSLMIDGAYEPSISPRSISSLQLEVDPVDPDLRPISYLMSESINIKYDKPYEFDPYAIDDDSYPPDIKRQWPPKTQMKIASSTSSSVDLPTPSTKTLFPPTKNEAELEWNDDEVDNDTAKKFVEFSPVNPGNAISVQNSFRQLLNTIFPPSEHYSQYYYFVAPEADRLWKPVFGNDENATIRNEGRTVDQIIAFGCEEGVKKDFFYQISGHVEKLGSKRDGLNRSGKLDIKYLISNVMQAYSSIPSNQQSSNPHSNPNILAALLVPHIEAFLASNTSTRLLILHYTASDLPTIFALRKLLGTDLLKIAGILDSLASDPPSMSRPGTSVSSRPRTPNPSNLLSNEAEASCQQSRLSFLYHESLDTLERQVSATASLAKSYSQTKKPAVSFAKADYLLPSTATDAEITTFLSGVWKSLMEQSVFYTPEPETKPVIIERPTLPPTPSSAAPRDRDRDSGYPASSYGSNPRASKVSRLIGGAATGSIRGGNYAPSINSTTTTTRGRGGYATSTTTSRHMYATSITSTKTTNSERERRQGEKDWENFYIGEEDSDDDAYDRMTLGLGMQKIVPEVRMLGQKRNTKKALKWLGLA